MKIKGNHGPKAKMSFRRNVLPPVTGILVTLGILAAMNGQLLLAQYKYHRAKPAATNAVSISDHAFTNDGSVDSTKSPHPELGPRVSIPAISVDAPVVFEPGTAEWQIQLGLRKGVVHYGSSANPGAPGNVVLFGHSSGQPWAPGDYKFVFTLLDKLKPNDRIFVDNGGIRYTYRVVRSEVVVPTDVGVLSPGPKPELTLITCTPVGTSKNRLVVHAEQISPKPVKSTAGTPTPQNLEQLPGSAR